MSWYTNIHLFGPSWEKGKTLTIDFVESDVVGVAKRPILLYVKLYFIAIFTHLL